jgi:hypothetical protein
VADLDLELEECLQALKRGSALPEVLRQYPDDRHQLVELLRLTVDLGSLQPPPPDYRFKLRARNSMLTAAARRRTPLGRRLFQTLVPRPALLRVSLALALVAILVTGVGALASNSLPGDPLYAVKVGLEQAQMAVTLDPTGREQLRLRLAEERLSEAHRILQSPSQIHPENLDELIAEHQAEVLQRLEALRNQTGSDRGSNGPDELNLAERDLAQVLAWRGTIHQGSGTGRTGDHHDGSHNGTYPAHPTASPSPAWAGERE